MILVALDGSARAPGVLAQAIAAASAHGERLVLFRSIGLPADVPQDLWRSTDEPLLDVLDHRARAYLEECEAKVPTAVRGGMQVVVGSPWQSICETAHRLGCDLVIIGSHGYSGLTGSSGPPPPRSSITPRARSSSSAPPVPRGRRDRDQGQAGRSCALAQKPARGYWR